MDENQTTEETAPNPPYGVKEGVGNVITFDTQAEFDKYILGLALTVSQTPPRFLAARAI